MALGDGQRGNLSWRRVEEKQKAAMIRNMPSQPRVGFRVWVSSAVRGEAKACPVITRP